ncbi:hypothetical protein OQA88_11041 [Cercophora sp. LCS_1]
MRLHSSLVLVAASLSGRAGAQNCPFLGPAYPYPTDAAAPAFVSAGNAFDAALKSAVAEARIPGNSTFYAIQVYTPSSKKLIYETYYSPTTQKIGPDTVFRVHSISKLITVYTIISKLGDKYWDEPVAKYIPELARLQSGNPAYDVIWDDVTIGSLASLMSGVGRDYSFADFSANGQPKLPGLRDLDDSDVVKCGTERLRPCTREEALRDILKVWPFSQSYATPSYSNMAFQILAYAAENITGTPFPTLVKQQLIEPLGLRRTFVTNPGNISDFALAGGWETDFGDLAPMGGYFSSPADLTALGVSILNSTLMPELTTRKWLKPLTHTASLYTSIGRPWEILRQHTPISSTSKTTRIVDVYTKQGGGQTYTTLIALSPVHNIGISILTAGPQSGAAFKVIKKLSLSTWPAAAEQAAREAANANFGGSYSLFGRNSSLEIGLHPDGPGLFMSKLVSNGSDILEVARNLVQAPGRFGLWFYPMNLIGRAFSGTEQAFRGAFGEVNTPAAEDCAGWAEGDRLRYGRYPGDLAVFSVNGRGQTTGVTMPMLNDGAFRKAGAQGGIFGRERHGKKGYKLSKGL